MLATQPTCYLVWPFTESIGKLLFIQPLFTHKSVKSIRNSKRESGFLTFLLRNLIEDFL